MLFPLQSNLEYLLQKPSLQISMPDQQIKVVIVHDTNPDNNATQQFNEPDPLLQQLQEMKITSNLIKEITFNPTVNKFEYLEQLLAQEYKEFNSKVNELSVKQRDIVTKDMKTLNRTLVRMQEQILKKKESASNNTTLLGNRSELLELHKRVERLIETKKNSEKFLKLSQGMLNAVTKLEKELDEHVKGKISELKK